jgi:hypothetical protein
MGADIRGDSGHQFRISKLGKKLLENGAQVRQHRPFFDKANQEWDSSV